MLRTVGSDTTINTETTRTTVNQASVNKVNTQLVARLVGFLEYRQALSHLDRLLNMVSPAELEAVEQIVRSRDEFVVYTDLAQRLMAKPAQGERTNTVSSQRGKRGLGWVMALARVELAAMVAGFTDRPRPFQTLPPSRYELPQYRAILLDSMRTHYLALRSDPVVREYVSWRGSPLTPGVGRQELQRRFLEGQAIAYARRVMIANEFIEAAQQLADAQSGGQQNSRAQRELQQARSDLLSLRSTILYRVLGLGTFVSTTQSSTGPRNIGGERMSACPRLLAIARQDLASGRAKVRPLRSFGQPQ